MLALAYQYQGQQDSVLALLTRVEELPFEVAVTAFQETDNGRKLQGTVTALESASMRALKDSVTFMKDSLAKDTQRLESVKKTLSTKKDDRGRPVPVTILQPLQKQQPVLEQRIANIQAKITALGSAEQAAASAGVAIPPITFEFLDRTGKVVASQTVPNQSVAPNQSKQFDLTAVGEGIEGWRYKTQS
jgi:hypothetical protein